MMLGDSSIGEVALGEEDLIVVSAPTLSYATTTVNVATVAFVVVWGPIVTSNWE
jgi:hypothetical protein